MATTTPTLFLNPPSPSLARQPGMTPNSPASTDETQPNPRGLTPTGQPINQGATGDAGLIGIARLAANAPLEKEKNNVEYFRIGCRSILNRCYSERVPFTWTINPYRGCEFGCRYCYARYTHEYMELDPAAFEQKIYAKQDAACLLKNELGRVRSGESIAIGTATDPYQPAERQFGVTRQILETLAEARGLSLSITTKSNQIVRDVDVLQKIAGRSDLHINITITTLRARLARALEPRAPRPDLRLKALAALRQAGLHAGVFVMPVLPGITDREADLEALAEAAAKHQAQWLAANVLFLMPSAQKVFFPFLDEKFPRLARQYRRWYARSGYAPEEYRARIAGLFARLRAKHGFASRPYEPDRFALNQTVQGLAAPEPQMSLGFVFPPTKTILPDFRMNPC
ncbi:MAG TPA: radical SAM protein [Candidatus Acidoferrales bacterium]